MENLDLRRKKSQSEYREIVEKSLAEASKSETWVSVAASETLKTGGKRLRPIVALLVCEAVSGSYEAAVPVALAYELAHSASLIQDDIIDESSLRHAQPTAHKKYGVTRAILVSDMLIFEIFSQLARYGKVKISKSRLAKLLDYVASAAKGAAEGEFQEEALRRRGEIRDEDYVRVASLKTGALFAAAAASGALVAGGDGATVRRMYDYGRNLGIAFQIQDDVLDFVGESDNTGKPVFEDMQNNACNIVIAHALWNADPYKRNVINSMLYKKWFAISDAKRLVAILKELGSLDHATSLARRHLDRCGQLLSTLPDSPARELLLELTRSVEGRRG